MKVLAIADHVDPALYDYFDPARWSDIDLILSCGDLPPGYLDFLLTSLGKPVLYVRGNHDGAYPSEAYAGCHDLNTHVWHESGLNIAGFEGSRRYNRGPVQYSDDEMRRHVLRTSRRLRWLDIVVTHAPPHCCHSLPDLCHTGFDAFDWLIERYRPLYLVHGHTHLYGAAQRVTTIGSTQVINAYGHCVLELPGSTA